MLAHTLRNTIKELYGLQGNANDAIDAIAIYQIVNGFSEEIRSQSKILQLTRNKSLECLLELVEDKLSGNMLFVNSSTVRDKDNESKVESDRITKLEQMFETLLKKVDNMGESKSKQTCGYCGKANHVESSCFKLKTCFKCNSKGHIAKFCKQNDSETASLRLGTTNGYDRQKKNLIPAERFLLKIKVCEKLYEFLYDTGSQFSIIKRSIYDDLPNKQLLHGVTQCGIGIEGSKFIFDGVVYLNLGLRKEEGHTYNLEYGPVFVSSQILTNIYGMKTQERFKSCLKDHENLALVYSPRVGDENITKKCYKEKVSTTTASVQIAKSCVVEKGSVAVVEGKICHFDQEKFKETFMLENAIELDQAIYTEYIKLESPSIIVKIPVYNESEDDIKLCKNDTVATLTDHTFRI